MATTPCCSMRPAPQFSILKRLAAIFPPAAGAPARLPSILPLPSSSSSSSLYARQATTAAASVAEPGPLSTEDLFEDDDDDDEPDFSSPMPSFAGSPPPDPTNITSANNNLLPVNSSTTGAFQRLPMVSPSKEIIESALKRAERVGGNKKLKNEAARVKNRAARQLDALMKELALPLGTYEKGFPKADRLHPFEKALLELTVGPGTYDRALIRVCALRKATVEVAKGYAARASKAPNKRDALAFQVEGFSRVEAVFNRGADAVDELKELAKSLRRLPVVDPKLPTVALVGAPNVGKSSLVQLLSSGLPEVQNYPFTTRSIKMGHFYVDSRRHQVTDTPGLLNRSDEDRNAMERLTLASLQHLPTAVLFVCDLTGECGTSVADQWAIRRDLKAKFSGKPWLDVLSKADLLEEEFDEADERNQRKSPNNGAASDSSSKSSGDREDESELSLSSSASTTTPASPSSVDVEVEADVVVSAIDFAAALPNALRVSSLTGVGIETLKASMLTMLEESKLSSEGLEAWWEEEEGGVGEGEGGEEVLQQPILLH